jgi:hypothetical protein
MWTTCLSTLTKLMDYRPPKALQNCQKTLNHHRSRQLLNILLNGNTKELVLPVKNLQIIIIIIFFKIYLTMWGKLYFRDVPSHNFFHSRKLNQVLEIVNMSY